MGGSLRLGDSASVLTLRSGWSCTIGPTSKKPSHEARITLCSKRGDLLEFSVQCETSRPRDHVQVRLRNTPRSSSDYIDVSCELQS
jgi:hypothetical protein